MRKWMSDRLKRRKKTAEESKGEAKPAPLQPAYFDKETSVKSDKEQASSVAPPEKSVAEADDSQARFFGVADSGRHKRDAEHSGPRSSEHRLTHVPQTEDQPRQHHAATTGEGSQSEGSSSNQPRPAGSHQMGSSDSQRSKRRRGRGGRGRGRNAPAQPVVAAAPGVQVERPDHQLDHDHDKDGQVQPVNVGETPAAGVSGAPRASKGLVVLAIGLPGSGKSSWFKRHEISPLSSDLIRSLLFDDPTEQRFQDLVFSNLRSMLKARLIARRPTNYVDATNLTPHERAGWIKLAKDYGYEVQAVYFDVPLETCLERNHKRERVVSDDVMRRMSGKLKAPTFEEGFSKITVVRVKQKE
jgi:predicted kinase